MLFGWVPFTIFLFYRLPAHRAVLVSVIGGWLLLPTFLYDLPGFPAFSKSTAIALGLILGGRLSGRRRQAAFAWKIYDLPMLLWCLSPLLTSLDNQLGWYDGLSGVLNQTLDWGIPYLAGRIYFNTPEAIWDLCLGIVIGGLLYVPLCSYELRMSPQLSNIFYGFFPHEWLQHFRYGGWRPIVFMKHGLMVSLWMAVSAVTAFWLWRSRAIQRIKGIPMGLIVTALIITSILSKSANGWFFLTLGCGSYFLYRSEKRNLLFLLLILLIPLYMATRGTGYITAQDIETMAANLFDAERVSSLAFRLKQEDLFILKSMEKPLFGWSGYGRGWPVDPNTGELISIVDSFWIIFLNTYGMFGIISFFSAILLGPFCILRMKKPVTQSLNIPPMIPVLLSLVVVFFITDSLFNGMENPVYILISGALVGWHLFQKQMQRDKTGTPATKIGILSRKAQRLGKPLLSSTGYSQNLGADLSLRRNE